MPVFGANFAQDATPLRDKGSFRVCGLPGVKTELLCFAQTFHNERSQDHGGTEDKFW
jgi:hypothetical protein